VGYVTGSVLMKRADICTSMEYTDFTNYFTQFWIISPYLWKRGGDLKCRFTLIGTGHPLDWKRVTEVSEEFVAPSSGFKPSEVTDNSSSMVPRFSGFNPYPANVENMVSS